MRARFRAVAGDLAGWLAVLVGATAIKGAILVGALRIDPRRIPWGDPRVYLLEYLTPLLVLPALTWLLHRRGESWRGLGLRRPASGGRFALRVGAVTGLALLVNLALRRLPTLWGDAWPPSPFEALAGHPAAAAVAGAYTVLLVGLTEELMFRGFVLSRLARLGASTDRAWTAAAVATALLFGLAHLQHGLLAVANATALGLLFAFAYLRTDRNLWLPVAAHSLYDTLRLLQYLLG